MKDEIISMQQTEKKQFTKKIKDLEDIIKTLIVYKYIINKRTKKYLRNNSKVVN